MNNILLELATDFSVDIVNLCKEMKNDYISSSSINQMLRSSSSIMANLAEANYGESINDMRHKFGIALKEAGETSAWLTLLVRCKYIKQQDYARLSETCNHIIAMIKKSIGTLSKKIKANPNINKWNK